MIVSERVGHISGSVHDCRTDKSDELALQLLSEAHVWRHPEEVFQQSRSTEASRLGNLFMPKCSKTCHEVAVQ